LTWGVSGINSSWEYIEASGKLGSRCTLSFSLFGDLTGKLGRSGAFSVSWLNGTTGPVLNNGGIAYRRVRLNLLDDLDRGSLVVPLAVCLAVVDEHVGHRQVGIEVVLVILIVDQLLDL
jgi:hypothetical protein